LEGDDIGLFAGIHWSCDTEVNHAPP